MKENSNDKINATSDTIIIKRIDSNCNDLLTRLKHFIFEVIITVLFAKVYFNYFRQLSINEIISLNNDVSFSFINLKIKLFSTNKISTRLIYKKNSEYKETDFIYKNEIDIKSELKANNLILEDEDKDFIAIGFFLNGKNFSDGSIEIQNEIYTFNMSEKDFKAKKQIRKKRFEIKEELYYSSKKREPRFYQYYIRSHSIKTLNESYNFSVIDDNYNIRPRPLDLENLESTNFIFAIIFKKKKFLNSLEIIGDSFFNILWNSFGTIVAIYEFLIPSVFFLIKDKRKLCLREKNQRGANLIKSEVSSNQNNQTEMNNIYNN